MIRGRLLSSFLLATTIIRAASAQELPNFSAVMELSGIPLENPSEPIALLRDGFDDKVATSELAGILKTSIRDNAAGSRSAKDVQIYRSLSPSVVLVVTKDGLGSGSLISASGDVLTNYHVIKGYSTVAVIFKPDREGAAPGRDDVRIGQVIRFDEVSDLALLKVTDVPPGRNPIRLGNIDDISVGADVHAIGHPTGEAWTYTTGIISQYRTAYKWKNGGEDVQHVADVIQTQTPINPGNSGGPLIGDAGTLIGVNSFKTAKGEGLNFAVSVDDVKRLLLRTSKPVAPATASTNDTDCKPKVLSKYRSSDNSSSITSLDMFCNGRASGEYVVPDKPSAAVFLRVDRNGDGKADVIFFDLKRSGKWDISWWDDNYTGQWSLVGYHDDGTLKPSRFESYADYQKRVLASRQPN
jgi:S1-C subfamily serine protease